MNQLEQKHISCLIEGKLRQDIQGISKQTNDSMYSLPTVFIDVNILFAHLSY